MPTSTTGDYVLPDVGHVSYNGVTFSALYKSTCEGKPEIDQAGRTTKYVNIEINVEGVVTLSAPAVIIDPQWVKLRKKLTEQGGQLAYVGKGFGPLNVNGAASQFDDVKWGPIPTILSFQPLGGSPGVGMRSAFIKWKVFACITEQSTTTRGQVDSALCQWSYGVKVEYDEAGYSHLSIKGVMEIPMTRSLIGDRSIPDMVDNYRKRWLDIQWDRRNLRVISRAFDYSPDKRTCEFSVEAEELPPGGLPLGANDARGVMTVRPINIGGSDGGPLGTVDLSRWAVTLRATYTIRGDYPRRQAYWDFLALCWARMQASANAEVDNNANPQPAKAQFDYGPYAAIGVAAVVFFPAVGAVAAYEGYKAIFGQANNAKPTVNRLGAVPYSFGIDEGLYLDSKSITFEMTWFLTTNFKTLILASGVWLPAVGESNNTWQTSTSACVGYTSWLSNWMDPNADIIVDLGGNGTTPNSNQPIEGEKLAGGVGVPFMPPPDK